MNSSEHVPNVPQIRDDELKDPELRGVIGRAATTKSPPPAWYRTMGHNPEVAKAFAGYWELLHRGGSVPHEIKELARIQIAQMGSGSRLAIRKTSPGVIRRLALRRPADFSARGLHHRRREEELRAAGLGSPGSEDSRRAPLCPHAHT